MVNLQLVLQKCHYTPKSGRRSQYIYIGTFTYRHRHMNRKKPKINKNLTTLAFVDRETNSLVIHVHGFEDADIAEAFASYMLNKSGMEYKETNDLFNTMPTIH